MASQDSFLELGTTDQLLAWWIIYNKVYTQTSHLQYINVLDSVTIQNRVMDDLSSKSENTCLEPKNVALFSDLTKTKAWNAMQMQIMPVVGTGGVQTTQKMLCLGLDKTFDIMDAPLFGAANCRLK